MHYNISIQSTEDIGRVQLTKWLLSLRTNAGRSLPNTLMLADELLAGGSLEAYLDDKEIGSAKLLKGVVFTPTEYENPYKDHFDEQAEYRELCIKGAAGDAEAAVAYCKLEMEGMINHAAYAG